MTLILNTDSILQILSIVVIATVSILAAIIAAKYTEKYRDRNENALEHFKQIKSHVIAPMVKQIDGYYLPILSFNAENLQWDRRDTKKFAVELNEQPVTYELVATTVSPNSSRRSISLADQEGDLTIERTLFQDGLKNHFNAIFEHWDKLTSHVSEYNQECLALANSITDSIAKKLELPILGAWDLPSNYVTPYCGVAIFNRMAGLQSNQLNVSNPSSGASVRLTISFGNPIIYLDSSADPNRAKGVIDEEIKERKERFLQLKAKAESLDKEFVSLRGQLAILLEKQKLTGNCDYI